MYKSSAIRIITLLWFGSMIIGFVMCKGDKSTPNKTITAPYSSKDSNKLKVIAPSSKLIIIEDPIPSNSNFSKKQTSNIDTSINQKLDKAHYFYTTKSGRVFSPKKD